MQMIKCKKLQKGSTIALLSPSWGGPSQFPGIFEKGIKNLQEWFSFKIIEYPTARMENEKIYNNPQLRADDINKAFADDSIDAIFISIGGNDSIRILPFLDLDIILSNPKIIMGFSDSTTFLCYLNSKGLVTFQGPSVMAGWAQIHNYNFMKKEYKEFLLTNHESRELHSYEQWSENYFDWSIKDHWGDVKKIYKNRNGYEWLQKGEKTQGALWGGCIEVIDFLKGTDYWPEKSFWENRILIFETSEDKPTPDMVAYSLRNLGMQGILGQISAILFGRAKDYSDSEKQDLYHKILQIVTQEFKVTNIPIVTNLDFGHTDPKMILPLGIKIEIDPQNKKIQFVEKIYSYE